MGGGTKSSKLLKMADQVLSRVTSLEQKTFLTQEISRDLEAWYQKPRAEHKICVCVYVCVHFYCSTETQESLVES